MEKSTMEVYAEVDLVLESMEDKYKNEVPKKLRRFFKESKLADYKKELNTKEPLDKQGFSNEALSILAFLNYEYWCKDENHKKELLNMYEENEKRYQEKLREQYNPNNIFKKNVEKNIEKSSDINNEVSMVEYKESNFKRIINKIKMIFNKN